MCTRCDTKLPFNAIIEKASGIMSFKSNPNGICILFYIAKLLNYTITIHLAEFNADISKFLKF